MDLRLFKQDNLFNATLTFFRDTIGLQLQTKSRMPIDLESQFETFGIKSKKVEELWSHVDKTYYIGLLDDDTFEKAIAEQAKSHLKKDLEEVEESDDEYPGILIFAVDLGEGFNPTRSNLTVINRTLNRFSQRVPALVLARYGNKISLMLADRVAYKQEWREGEKVRKVSLLRDIDLDKPHAGHLRILKDLVVPTSGTKKVESFDELYEYWKEVLDTSELNKKFYQDLSNWYFWAIKNVKFPSEPVKKENEKESDYKGRLKTHKAQNVIRLITRLIFTWFVKEKKLVPQYLFDRDEVSKIIELGDEEDSNYYKAILQNLFFATFNQEMEKREFRNDGQNYNVTTLYRYRRFFKDPEKGLTLFQDIPFLNGGLFECLDKKDDEENVVRVDGFSDRKDNQLLVPNLLFFGRQRTVDLSKDYGKKTKKYKEASVQGLFPILNKYIFTIAENTPLEEDVALDPELLGKVFENLLASYNPETKNTARKQTGSFYTPREIVNYMVDESMIAYLKNELTKYEGGYYSIENRQGDLYGNTARRGQLKMEQKVDANPWEGKEDELEENIRVLFSYGDGQPFEKEKHREAIIHALDNCKVLDPACGSGAFPMGILQKMVHVLKKLDPDNEEWKERQIAKAESLDDPKIREDLIQDIEEAFENNELDFGRKLYLIENCIYGVDIQPIAVQIAKLRFFISLVVDQKLDENRENLGIRPLPNLETRFVAANTLVGIDKPDQLSLRNPKIERQEKELERVRHHHFSAKTPKTKRKWRERDKEIREEIADLLKSDGWGDKTAEKLAKWDPYDQIRSSSFFDSDWMFGIVNGFDILIGNPPYILVQNLNNIKDDVKNEFKKYETAQYKIDLYHIFIEKGINLLNENGIITYITPNTFIKNKHTTKLREFIINKCNVLWVILFYTDVFNTVSVDNIIFSFSKTNNSTKTRIYEVHSSITDLKEKVRVFDQTTIKGPSFTFNFDLNKKDLKIISKIESGTIKLKKFARSYFGIQTYDRRQYVSKEQKNKLWKPVIDGSNISPYQISKPEEYVYFSKEAIKSGGNPEVYKRERIVVRQIGKYPEGAICEPEIYTLKTIYNIYLTNNSYYSIRALLGVLNSRLVQFYWTKKFFDNKATFPKIKKNPLESIPMKFDSNYNQIIDLLVQFLEFSLKINKKPIFNNVRSILDGVIFELYFSEEMRDKNINILKFVLDDIEDIVSEDKAFNKVYSINNKEVLTKLFEKWSHPENEIRNRIKLFAVRSPEILKPILKG